MNDCRNWFRIVGMCLLSLPAAIAAQAQSGDYPNKAVTVISDAAPGATPDIDARFCADGLSKMWGQQAVVVNRQGAFGSLAARALDREMFAQVAGDQHRLERAAAVARINHHTLRH